MPHLPGTAHTLKVALGWQYGLAQQCENIFYLFDATDGIFSTLATVASTIKTQVSSHLVAHQHNTITYNQCGLEDVRTSTFGGIVIPYSPVVAGSLTPTNVCPSSVCLSVKKSTANLGRTGRGRWYWPIVETGLLVNGDSVSSSHAANVVSDLTAFQAGVEAALPGVQMGIVSYHLNGSLRTNGLFQQITSWGTADLFVDSQRRRLAGRGR